MLLTHHTKELGEKRVTSVTGQLYHLLKLHSCLQWVSDSVHKLHIIKAGKCKTNGKKAKQVVLIQVLIAHST